MRRENLPSRNALESGVPCTKHKCALCCVKTEMPLSHSDMDRISKLGYTVKDFAVKSQNGWQLKNRFGKCVFLSSNGCIIYAYRPEGCQLYPLVFDEETGRNVKDDVCPHRGEFRVTRHDKKKLTLFLQKLKMEAIQ
jgi:Fe-S-cluster containining protein